MRRFSTAARRASIVVACLMALPAFLPAVETATTDAAAPSDGVRGRIEGFFSAFNSGDVERMLAFYAEAATEDFRSRRSEDDHRALYRRLRDDLGDLDVREVRRESAERVQVDAVSERIPMPVQFGFELKGGLIDGLSVRVGGPPPGGGPAELDLPEGADYRALAAALERRLGRLAEDGVFSGVVLLARGGEPFFHRAYGMANRDAGTRNGKQTRFDVGSITKLVTKIGIGQLLRDGKLTLDDTILEHLPDYPNREVASKVTVGHLLDHRSGLGDIFNDRWEAMPKEKLVAPRDFFPLFADGALAFEPGEGRSYSNAGYIVLGAILEAASGMPYASYVEEKIFRPAGMSRSGFPLRDGTVADLAIGYTRQGGPGEPRPNLGMLPIRGCPAGSSAHTAEDLLRLDRALREGRLLGPVWTEWAFTGVAPGDDAGQETGESRTVGLPIGVAGGGPGVNAGLESDGETTVIVLANVDPPVAEDLAVRIHEAMAR